MDRRELLMDYVRTELVRGRDLEVTEQTDLLSAGIVDSIGLLKLVTFVEERLGLRVPDEDVVFENFHSVKAMMDYLSNH